MTGSWVDTDVSFTIEVMGVVYVLCMLGKTYVRGYDGYIMTSSGVVKHSVEMCNPLGWAVSTP